MILRMTIGHHILHLALALLFLTPPALAQEAPRRFGAGFGVNIKVERITEPELDMIAALGIKRVRVGFSWYEIEKQKGEYRFDYALPRDPAAPDYPERYVFSADWIMEKILARGLHPDVTLHVGNAVHTGDPVNIAPPGQPPSYRHVAPRTPESRSAFAAMAAATVKYFQEKYGAGAITWHIWNEPDFDGSWPPERDPVSFGRLLQESCEAIRAAVPRARIMGPAMGAHGDGDILLDFIAGMFKAANPLPCLDGFTVHPYRAFAPETAPADYAKVAAALSTWQPKDRPPVPVAVDEWGYSTNKHHGAPPFHARWRDFSETEQAALMLRMYLTNLAAGIPLTVLYDWRDRGTDPYEREDHFGVIGFKGEEKPAYRMFRATWKLLLDRPLMEPMPLKHCPPQLHALRFGARKDDARSWLVLWTETTPHSLNLQGAPQQMQDIFGHAVTWQDKTGALDMNITPMPLLLAETPGRKLALACRK